VLANAQFPRPDRRHLDEGALVGKVGSVFVCTGAQHGGQETTITSLHSTLLHHGMIIVGLPYSFPGLTNMDEITGGSSYGAGTLAKADGARQPSPSSKCFNTHRAGVSTPS
jgi:NAD(P)H dehydrogenase (quinone)